MKQIEVNGITYSVDESMFVTEEIKVGDQVQILKKDYQSWKTYPGVITQILPFDNKPAVEVVYVEDSYSSIEVKTILITDDTGDDVKMLTKANPIIKLSKERAVDLLQKKIADAEEALQKAKYNLEYFEKYLRSYFEEPDKSDTEELPFS